MLAYGTMEYRLYCNKEKKTWSIEEVYKNMLNEPREMVKGVGVFIGPNTLINEPREMVKYEYSP